MKKQLITFACLCIAPLAFGQSATNEAKPSGERTYTTNTSGDAKTGSVASFQPGQDITINSTAETHPKRFVVAKNVRYQKQGGGEVDPSLIKQGAKVQLTFNADGQVDRVILIDLD
jgi:hypothetical protein